MTVMPTTDIVLDIAHSSLGTLLQTQTLPQIDRPSIANGEMLLHSTNEIADAADFLRKFPLAGSNNPIPGFAMGSGQLQQTSPSDPSMVGNTTAMDAVIALQEIPAMSHAVVVDEIRCFDHGCSGRKFSTKGNFIRHLREKAGISKHYTCPTCGMRFTRSTAKAKHVKSFRCKSWMPYALGTNYTANPGWIDNQCLELANTTSCWPQRSVNFISYSCPQQAANGIGYSCPQQAILTV